MLPSEFWALSAGAHGRFPTASGSEQAGSLSCGKVGAVSQLLGSHWIAAAGFPIARVGWWTVFAGSLGGRFLGVTQCWSHDPGSWAAQLVGLVPKLLVSKTWLKILGLNNKCGACILHEISGHATLWFQGYVPGLILLHIMSKDSNYFFSLLIWENGNCFADTKFCTFYIPRVVQITLEVILNTVYFIPDEGKDHSGGAKQKCYCSAHGKIMGTNKADPVKRRNIFSNSKNGTKVYFTCFALVCSMFEWYYCYVSVFMKSKK